MTKYGASVHDQCCCCCSSFTLWDVALLPPTIKHTAIPLNICPSKSMRGKAPSTQHFFPPHIGVCHGQNPKPFILPPTLNTKTFILAPKYYTLRPSPQNLNLLPQPSASYPSVRITRPNQCQVPDLPAQGVCAPDRTLPTHCPHEPPPPP